MLSCSLEMATMFLVRHIGPDPLVLAPSLFSLHSRTFTDLDPCPRSALELLCWSSQGSGYRSKNRTLHGGHSYRNIDRISLHLGHTFFSPSFTFLGQDASLHHHQVRVEWAVPFSLLGEHSNVASYRQGPLRCNEIWNRPCEARQLS